MPAWFVYILLSRVKAFMYVGSTNNLCRRLWEHNEGLTQSTKPYRPLQLVAYVAVGTERKARELEKYFKTGSGRAVLKKRILDCAPAKIAGASSSGLSRQSSFFERRRPWSTKLVS